MTKAEIVLEMGELDAGVELEPTLSTPETRILLSDEAVHKPVVRAASWYVVLLVYRSKLESQGGLAFADSTVQAQEVFMSVGEILAIGPLAYKATTASGLKLWEQEIPKVGQYWAYPRHAGQPFPLRERYSNGAKATQLVMKDTELLGIVDDPDRIVSWLET